MQSVPYKKIRKYLGKVRKCSVCGNNSNKRKKSIWARDVYFKAIQCEKCNFISIDPCISEIGLRYYYQTNIERRLLQKQKTRLRNIQYFHDRDFITQYLKKGRILDVGCGGGFFLSKFSSKYEKIGLDLDKLSTEIGQKKFKIKIINERLGEENLPKHTFDLIVFRGVIEHLYEPKKAIERAYELLKKNGYLYFCATPNVESFPAYLYRSKWNLWHPVQHINMFTVNTILKMCGVKKFKKIDEQYEYLKTPYADPIKDYQKIKKFIIVKGKNKIKNSVSPPFWGNMISLILQKK